MDFKGAIFDLDGTLLDSMYIWDELGSDYLKGLGITPKDNLKEVLWPMTLTEAAQYFQIQYGVKDSVEEIISSMDHMIEHFYGEILQLKEGVPGYLEQLKNQKIKMCIATVTNRHLVEATLKRNGILEYFDFILTCEEYGSGKENPDIYLECLKRLGTSKDQTWIFEDTLHAIQTAKNAGFKVVAIYDTASKDKRDEIQKFADYFWERF